MSADGFAVGALPPGPVADRLAEAAGHVPDRPDRVLALAAEALALADGDPLAEALAQTYRGFARYLLSDHDAALDVLTRALAAVEPLGDLAARSLALGALASVHVSLGHYDQALELGAENLRVARALGDVEREAWVRATMGNTYVELDQPQLALDHGQAALRLFASLGHAGGQARAHTVMGGALADLGRYDQAEAHHRSALRLAREEGVTTTEARALSDLGELARRRGDGEASLAFHRDALRLRAARRQPPVAGDEPDRHRPGRSSTWGSRPTPGSRWPRRWRSPSRSAPSRARPRPTPRSPTAAQAQGDLQAAITHLRAYHALHESLLSAQARSRIQTVEVRAEAERGAAGGRDRPGCGPRSWARPTPSCRRPWRS